MDRLNHLNNLIQDISYHSTQLNAARMEALPMLRKLRHERVFGPKAMAAKLGVTTESFVRMELGEEPFTAHILDRWTKILTNN